MAKFPNRSFQYGADYFRHYTTRLDETLSGLDESDVENAIELLRQTIAIDGIIYSCGNGGSAALADHLACDCGKGLSHSFMDPAPRVVSLAANGPVLTAYANDLSYAEVFSAQIKTMGRSGDLLIAVSASGNSPNVLYGIGAAKQAGLKVITMTGFDGGKAKGMGDVNIYVPIDNYGLAEDAFQVIMHSMAQFLRQSQMSTEQIQIKTVKF